MLGHMRSQISNLLNLEHEWFGLVRHYDVVWREEDMGRGTTIRNGRQVLYFILRVRRA